MVASRTRNAAPAAKTERFNLNTFLFSDETNAHNSDENDIVSWMMKTTVFFRE